MFKKIVSFLDEWGGPLMLAFVLINVFAILYITRTQCKTYTVQAKILTINENITEGQLIGRFLGSPSGSFRNDTIKVGVSFKINGYLFLEDLRLKHAELYYYKESKEIPLTILIEYANLNEKNSCQVFGRLITGKTVFTKQIKLIHPKKFIHGL